MSKVVLLAINAKYVHTSLAAWTLAGGVSKYALLPHDVNVAETTIHQTDSAIADSVTAYMPDVVGISSYIWNAAKLPGLLKLLRERLPDAVFVLGGPEASHNAEYWLAQGAGYVIKGEGERCFPALLDSLDREKGDCESLRMNCRGDRPRSPAKRAQYVKRETEDDRPYGQTMETSGENQGIEIIDYPHIIYNFCISQSTITPEYYSAIGGRIAYLETSRGCPFRCAFCLSAGSGVRFFPLDTAKEQLYKLSESGTKTIKLVDRTFNCDSGRAYELFDYIIRMDTACRFHFEVAADLFDGRTLELLGSAPPGRIQFEAGLQSFFEPALKAASRQTDIEKAQRNIRTLMQGRNIHIHVDLIAGLPYETLPDFMDSFDRAYALGAHTLQLGFLKLLHGSRLRNQAETLGIRYAEEPPYEIRSSPWLGGEDIQTLKQAENALQHTYNKRRFLSAIEYTLSASKLRPFSFFQALGEAAPNHATHLDKYAIQIYEFCARLPGVCSNELRDRMIYDWLGMVKGRNMPGFLKNPDNRSNQVIADAKKALGREPGRGETAVLHSGVGVFVDIHSRDPVTGLYKVYEGATPAVCWRGRAARMFTGVSE